MTKSSRRLPAWSAGLLLAGASSAAALPAHASTADAASASLPSHSFAAPSNATPATAPEAQLLASAIGQGVVLLKNDDGTARDIMRRALDFGQVRAQTGNDAALMERTGVAMRLEREGEAPSATPDSEARSRNIAGGYMGGDIDLRFNFDVWRYAYAVTQPGADGWPSRSLQFFDAQGNAVHKLYLTNEVAAGLFDRLAEDFRAPDQHPPAPGSAAPHTPNTPHTPGTPSAPGKAAQDVPAAPHALDAPAEKPDSAINVQQFRQAWLAMTDAGQFGAVLAEFGVTREQALRLAPPGMVRRLAPGAVRAFLDEVARQKLGVMALVGNAGVTQVYTGPLASVAADRDALSAQAPGFSLRLYGDALRGGYAVQRAGAVSVEFFDAKGQLALSFFGLRDRTKPQAWVELVRNLPKE